MAGSSLSPKLPSKVDFCSEMIYSAVSLHAKQKGSVEILILLKEKTNLKEDWKCLPSTSVISG